VKNIPANTKDAEVLSLFEKHGSVGRYLFPPAKTVAIVEYLEPNEAKVAFQKLAYSKFKSVPLYLEWAPANIFIDSYSPDMKKPILEEKPIKIMESTLQDPLNDPDAMPVATVFVKNLNFETKESGLFDHFSVVNGLRSTRIPTKKAKNGTNLSLGYGFLEFDSKDSALNCLKTMQNSKLDNHVLELKFSNSVVKSTTVTSKKASKPIGGKTSKLIIRNIPFEASKSEIKNLFKSFGTIKSLRMPLNFNGSHRGFGFIDFSSIQDALNAYNSLNSTHIYGRHLVLEWAKDDDSIEMLRFKTSQSHQGNQKQILKRKSEDMSL
jgi:multiple RNA-binding domain-containing protein 1